MLKKSLRLVPLVAALFTVSFPVQAAEYRVVVPAPGKAAQYAAIKVELSPAILPVGIVGDSFTGSDFNTALRITGDPELDMSQVAWSVYTGSLPTGLSLSRDGGVYGTPSEEGELSFQALAKYKTKMALGTYTIGINDITLALDAELPEAHPRKVYSYSLAAQLSVDGDPAYTPDAVTWSLVDSTLPSGLRLTASGEISGTPEEDGVYPVTVQASYKGRSVSKVLRLEVVWSEINILAADGTRYWEDGTYAQSCKDYIQPSGQLYKYAGDTGDGIYRIAPAGATRDVYCDQATDGGGWTLLMKQAANDGVTLQGDTTYWKNGTTLNDNVSGRSMLDGNFVSAAFGELPVARFRLQAANEADVRYHDNATPMAGHVAFSDTNRVEYSDPAGTLEPSLPNWFVHADKYPAPPDAYKDVYPSVYKTHPNGITLSSARFAFNFRESGYSKAGSLVTCAVRWGWAGDENTNTTIGTHDACGGLGASGSGHGNWQMNNDKSAWNPATLYLWGK